VTRSGNRLAEAEGGGHCPDALLGARLCLKLLLRDMGRLLPIRPVDEVADLEHLAVIVGLADLLIRCLSDVLVHQLEAIVGLPPLVE